MCNMCIICWVLMAIIIIFGLMKRLKRYLYIAALFVMGLMASYGDAFAQSKEQLEELEWLALYGAKQDLIDSLDMAYSSGADSTHLVRIEALLAVRDGRHNVADEWFSELSSRDQRRFENLLWGTLISISEYQLDEADKRLKQLSKIRLKGEGSQDSREAVENLYAQVERLLKNVRAIEVLDTVSGSLDMIMDKVQSTTTHLGSVREKEYVTPDGLTKWMVSSTDDGVPAFSVVHQLGDGTWDYDHADMVEVRGLHEDSKIYYPRLMSDGNTLYFAVEEQGFIAEDGLGGKDIYVSRYDRDAGVLLVPQLLPMPFNSMSDDLIYLTDEASDIGWLVTSRGLKGNRAWLYTFKLSSVKRYEGDEIGDIALLKNPEVSSSGMNLKVMANQAVTPADEKVYFWIQNRPIRGKDDLKNPNAKNIFSQYLQSAESLLQLKDKLGVLRRQMSENPKIMNQLRSEVTALEERVEVLRAQSKALCNEVIKLEGQTR